MYSTSTFTTVEQGVQYQVQTVPLVPGIKKERIARKHRPKRHTGHWSLITGHRPVFGILPKKKTNFYVYRATALSVAKNIRPARPNTALYKQRPIFRSVKKTHVKYDRIFRIPDFALSRTARKLSRINFS